MDFIKRIFKTIINLIQFIIYDQRFIKIDEKTISRFLPLAFNKPENVGIILSKIDELNNILNLFKDSVVGVLFIFIILLNIDKIIVILLFITKRIVVGFSKLYNYLYKRFPTQISIINLIIMYIILFFITILFLSK